MYAEITKDLLFAGGDAEGVIPDRTGHVIFARRSKKDDPLLLDVRLLDDDREVYYEALADEESLEALLSWAMADVGCTILQTREGGQWRDAIG